MEKNRMASVSGYVSTQGGCYILADRTHTPVVFTDADADQGVIRAVDDLCEDIEDVTGIIPIRQNEAAGADIIIGTVGKSTIIDSMIEQGKLEVSAIAGKWECFQLQIVEGILVIAGSDKRGTIYGIYDLCEKMGVSPWKWWADVKTGHADGLYITLCSPYVETEPSVQYRGIFINDEYAFDNWAINRGDYDLTETYKHIYELLLRLKANMLWPAMHGGSPCFHKNPANAANAGLYGIVIGSSHCEMLLRNNVSEYFGFEKKWEEENPGKPLYKKRLSDSPIPCAYVYIDRNPDTGETVYNKQFLHDYWRESVELYGTYENVFTMGMRGLHDATWQPEGVVSIEEKARLLEEIIAAQRTILSDVLKKEPEEIPQLFIPYKEIQEIYDTGMEVPDDMTLMWTDDNYGYIRQLPTGNNRHRAGGAGIYYHVGYHGSPNSYIWLSTTPFALIREEMSKAYDYGAKKVWILNVGDLKPAESRIEYFLDLARNVPDVRGMDLSAYIIRKAKRDFSFCEDAAAEYAAVELGFQKLVYARKPEHFLPDLFQYQAFGDEGQRYLKAYQKLTMRSEALYDALCEELKPAFFELQLYPLRACCNTAEKYINGDKARLAQKQKRGSAANRYAADSDAAYYKIVKDTKEYNSMLCGRWKFMMDPYQPSFTTRRAVLSNLLPHQTDEKLGYAKLGISPEQEMDFSVYSRDRRFIDIYNTGSGYIDWKISADQEWLVFSKEAGTVICDERIWVWVRWEAVLEGTATAVITVTGLESDKRYHKIEIPVTIDNRVKELPEKTYVEAHGYVSMEAEHFSHMAACGECEWRVEKNLGRSGDSIKIYPNLIPAVEQPGAGHSASVEYRIYFESTGCFPVDIYRLPTLNERGDVHVAIGLDGETPSILTGTKAYVNDSDASDSWGKGVYANNEILTGQIRVAEAGIHTLRIYHVDPGIVIDKIVIYTRMKEPSYFGPPESYNSTYQINDSNQEGAI